MGMDAFEHPYRDTSSSCEVDGNMRDNRNVNMDGGHKRNMDRSDTTLMNFMHASHAYILVDDRETQGRDRVMLGGKITCLQGVGLLTSRKHTTNMLVR
ncbi:unnamed protein product [Fusarium graminearum]|uniref:Chromosome 3, complete genome n=1 Tax=Gibberella zeae (strain ATCC MYA-4620 / CBS 123657 / FGSC 9075 / NRRL 31084 / PH-1) TaxID=229533 RepID=A0A098E190_GIBZE|nr:unnamed protein product [Fusarium graminearum]CZS83536.1 unnamed protein product [Fusarium graminearum]